MENRFIRADDVAQELNVSKPYAVQSNPNQHLAFCPCLARTELRRETRKV